MQITASLSDDKCRTRHFCVRYRTSSIGHRIGSIQLRQWAQSALAVLLLGSGLANAQEKLISIVEPESRSQLWINPGFVSYHFDQNKNLNNGYWGAGAEYRFSTVASATIGRFYNSNRFRLGPSSSGQWWAALMATRKTIMAAGLRQPYLRSRGKEIGSAPMSLLSQR